MCRGSGAFSCPLEPGGPAAERLKCDCEPQAEPVRVRASACESEKGKTLNPGSALVPMELVASCAHTALVPKIHKFSWLPLQDS